MGELSADFGYPVARTIWIISKAYLLCAAPGIAAYVIRGRATPLPGWFVAVFLGPIVAFSAGVVFLSGGVFWASGTSGISAAHAISWISSSFMAGVFTSLACIPMAVSPPTSFRRALTQIVFVLCASTLLATFTQRTTISWSSSTFRALTALP